MNFTGQSTDASHATHTIDRQQLLGDGIVDEPGDCLLVALVRGDREGQQRPPRGGTARYRGIAKIGGQFGPHPADGVAHIVDGLHRILFQDKLDGDRDRAFKNLCVEVLDALHRRDRVFQLAGNLGFKRCRRSTRKRSLHGDHRQFDIGEVLNPERAERQQTAQRQQDEQQDRGDRMADREG